MVDFYKKGANKSIMYKVLVQVRHLCTSLLYLADNIVWLGNIGILSKTVYKNQHWRNYKDGFAMLRCVFTIIHTVIDYYIRRIKL